jgi:hypothetical protein
MNGRLSRQLALIGVFVAWLFVVTFNYYIVHKPFSVENALALLGVAADVLTLALLLLLATSLGHRFTSAFQFDSPLEGVILCAGLGWGLLSFSILAVGLVGALQPLVFWGGLALGLLLLRRDVRSVITDVRALRLPITSRFEGGLAIFVSVTLALALIRAFTPPLAWDAQVYHLTFGKYWIAQGRITAPPDIPYFSFPALVENLYLGALLLRGDSLAQAIHWSFLLLTPGLVFLLAQRSFSTRTAWLATALLVAVPSFVLIASWAYVDAALAFYATAAFYSVTRAIAGATAITGATRVAPTNGTRWFILAGAFTGLALGVKYTAIIVPAALLVVVFVHGLRRELIRQIAVFAGAAALLAAPWYIRNWVFQGNPIYPFLFGGPFWDSFRAEQFARFGSGLIHQPLRLAIAAWEATITGQEGAVGYEATIGPLLLLLLPALFLTRRRDNHALRSLLIFCGVLYAFWLFGVAASKLLWQTRLLFPAFPALAVAAAYGMDGLSELDLPQFSLARFARLVIVVTLGLTLAAQTLDLAALNPLPFLTGFETRDEYLSRRLPPNGYYAAMQSLSALSPNDKVLFLWEPRSYYASGKAQLLPDALLDHFGDLRFRLGTPTAMAAALRAEGYTHILLNRAGLNYYVTTQYDPVTREEVAALQELLAENFVQLSGHNTVELAADGSVVNAESDTYALYQIVPKASAGK